MSLTRKRKIGFGLTNFGSLMAPNALTFSVIPFYTTYTIFSQPQYMPLLGLAMMVFGIWDALNDPLIGQWSDKTRSRWGRRKPFIMVGVPFLALFYFLLFNPGLLISPLMSAESTQMFILFAVLLCAYDVFLTMSTLWYAMYPEISATMEDRLEISTYLQISGIIGLAFGIALPPLLTSTLGWTTTSLILCLIIIVSFSMPLISVKEKREYSMDKPLPFGQALKSSVKNKSFLTYMGTQLTLSVTYSIALGTLWIYTKWVLGLTGMEQFAYLGIMLVFIVPGLAIWLVFTRRKGPKKALTASVLVLIPALILTLFIGDKNQAIIMLVLAGIGLAGPMMLPTVMLADVCDEDELKTGARREGMYTGISGFITKVSTSVSALVITSILAYSGYVGTATTQPETALLGMRLVMGIVAVIPLVISLVVLSRYPLIGGTLAKLKKDVEALHKEKSQRLSKRGQS